MSAKRPRVSTYFRKRENYWTVRWRENGRQFEDGGFTTEDDAEDHADTIRKRLRQGLPGTRETCLIKDVVAHWYDGYVHSPSVTRATRDGYKIDARRILETLGNVDAHCSTARIRKWRDEIAQANSPRIANKAHTALSSAYERALEHDPPMVERNPCRGLSRLPETLQPIELPTRLHVEYLEATARSPRELAMLMIASRGGLRQSELLGLRWGAVTDTGVYVSQVAEVGRQIRESTKTKRSQRRVPLPTRALEAVEALRPVNVTDATLIFESPADAGRPMQRTSWSRHHWKPWKRAAAWNAASDGHPEAVWGALLRLKWKDMRHHAISRWGAAGATITQVSKWSGDSIKTIDKHYAHLFDEDETDIMHAIG